MILGGSDRDARLGSTPFRLCVWGSVCASLCDRAITRARAVYGVSRSRHRALGHAPLQRFCRSGFGFPRARDVLVRVDCFCRRRRSRDRTRRRASAKSPKRVLGMVCVDHSPNGDDRVRVPHDTLVSIVAGAQFRLGLMSALGQKHTCAAHKLMSESDIKYDVMECPFWAISGHQQPPLMEFTSGVSILRWTTVQWRLRAKRRMMPLQLGGLKQPRREKTRPLI